MTKPTFVVSLMMEQNDYQQTQAAAARDAAKRLDIELKLIYANNDAVTQSQQLLDLIQSPQGQRPNGIICHPVGTVLTQVARSAVSAGIGWVLLNRDLDQATELRSHDRVPVFSVGIDQEEVGRIQGKQFGVLLPQGGLILYLQGPAGNPALQKRTLGMTSTKPANIEVRMLRGHLTEQSGYDAIASWLRLATSRQSPVSLVGSHNDNMAMGARRAFEENTRGEERERWSQTPYTGCDGRRETGQEWVRKGLLSATVVLPPTVGMAMEMLLNAIRTGVQPAEHTRVLPASFPTLEELSGKQAKKNSEAD